MSQDHLLMKAASTLQVLGFTEYEARAYLMLVDSGPLNGYELAKASGIPRANIYAVADKLLQRGAVQRLQDAGGLRYVAVPPKHLLHEIETRQKQALADAKRSLTQRPRRHHPAAVFTLRDGELLAKARQLIETSKTSITIAIQPAEAALLAEPLRMARERDVGITTLCLEACPHDCGACQGKIHRYSLAPSSDVRRLVLVADQESALIGQFGAAAVEGIVTSQRLMVELATAYIQQSLALAIIGSDKAGRFHGLLSQEARSLLQQIYPSGDLPAYIQSLTSAPST